MSEPRSRRASDKTAAIVGGSLGGLTAAALLRDLGWSVTVFERSPIPLGAFGAGLVVHPATVRYLVERLSLDIDDISCPAPFTRTYGPNGAILHEEERAHHVTSWSTIYSHLLRSFGTDDYRLDHQLVELAEEGDRVGLVFANGDVSTADLVVCADGIGSTARRILLGDIGPSYSGYVGWRGLCDGRELGEATSDALDGRITYGVGDRSHIVAYPIPVERSGDRAYNFVWYRNVDEGEALPALMTGRDGHRRSVSLPPGTVRDQFITELRDAARRELAPPLCELVTRTKQPFLQVIVDLEVPAMAFGRVALIGDGAFSARPHAAAGTAKAAEDGWQLASALRRYGADVPAALRTWESGQLALGRHLVGRSRGIGDRLQVRGTWRAGDPSLRFGLYGPDR